MSEVTLSLAHQRGETDSCQEAGDSTEQRNAELLMLESLGRQLGVTFRKQRLKVGEAAHVEIDGVTLDPPILVEAWAHQGTPKSAQKTKVLADALKLLFAERAIGSARKILLFSDTVAAAHFQPHSRSWAASALQEFGIDVCVVELPDSVKGEILHAQRRQFR